MSMGRLAALQGLWSRQNYSDDNEDQEDEDISWNYHTQNNSVDDDDGDIEQLTGEFTATLDLRYQHFNQQLPNQIPVKFNYQIDDLHQSQGKFTLRISQHAAQKLLLEIDHDTSYHGLDLSASESEDDVFVGEVSNEFVEQGLEERVSLAEKLMIEKIIYPNEGYEDSNDLWTAPEPSEHEFLFGGRVKNSERKCFRRKILKSRSTLKMNLEMIPPERFFKFLSQKALSQLSFSSSSSKTESICAIQSLFHCVFNCKQHQVLKNSALRIQSSIRDFVSCKTTSCLIVQSFVYASKEAARFYKMQSSTIGLKNHQKSQLPTILISRDDYTNFETIEEITKKDSLSIQKKRRSVSSLSLNDFESQFQENIVEPRRKRIKWIDIDGHDKLENFEPVGSGSHDLGRQPTKPILKPSVATLFPKQKHKKGIFAGLRFIAPRVSGKPLRVRNC